MVEEEKGKDLGGFFAVEPKRDCPHTNDTHLAAPDNFRGIGLDAPCPDCNNIGENWVCLKCSEVRCSRYVNEHMLMHAIESSHALALSFSDLSVWCYHCESYIESAALTPVLGLFRGKKFGVDDLAAEIDGLSLEESKAEEPGASQKEETKQRPEETKQTEAKQAEVKAEEEIDPRMFYKKTTEELAEKLKAGVFQKIAILAGAGISVSAGIPDFRSPGTGLYSKLAEYNLDFPEQIFELKYFKSNPQAFFTFSKELFGDYKPTPTHYFFKLLHDKGLLTMCYSQNIDGLECDAGLPAEKLMQAHGHYRSAHCTDCGREYDITAMKQHISEGTPAFCETCSAPAKPDVVFFGENLPPRFFVTKGLLKTDVDLVIILGTSLAVYPFAGLAFCAPKTVPRVLINREAPESPAALNSFRFDLEEGNRDVFLQGDSDAIIAQLVELCGWQEEFAALQKA